MTTTVTWTDPPERTRGRGAKSKYAPIVAELQAHPGKWALVARAAKTSVAQSLKNLGCETSVRANDKGGSDIYARWPVAEEAEEEMF